MSDIVIPGRDAINRWAYLSAYALAVKHGFVGTEIEWLASLHGEQGDQGDPGTALNYKGEYAEGIAYVFNDCVMYENDLYIHIGEESTTGTAPTDTDTWSMIFSASEAADDIAAHVADAEAAATAAATAQAAAETAKTAAETARAAAETAQAAAEEAQGRAEDAVTDAEAAQDAAEDAQTAAETAATASAASATAASGYESSARTHAYNAQVSAGEAGSYASGAQVAQAAAEAAQAGAEEAESDASDAVGAAAGYASDSQAWATGYRGSTPVSSGDQYHNNSKYWADESKAAQIAAQTAKTGAESANTSAQAAKTAAESANTSAQAAKTAAETAQAGAETAQAAAEAAATTAAEAGAEAGTAAAQAVVADKADLSYAQYIALREEEDRQILMGSIVEAAEDSYPELRSAPIHNAITIGGSVYPRMDRTRMAIDAIKGRTVAFNQLIQNGDFADGTNGWNVSGGSATVSGGIATFTASEQNGYILSLGHHLSAGHKYLVCGDVKLTTYSEDIQFRHYLSGTIQGSTLANTTAWQSVRVILNAPNNTTDSNFGILDKRASGWDAIQLRNFMLFDLTQDYGTTLADQIYALEQATTGAGVAYVRQRMDLDYYAANAGTLTAPVVSGVTVTGFNLWDEEWEVGGLNPSTGATTGSGDRIRAKNMISCTPNTTYAMRGSVGSSGYMCFYDADGTFISCDDSISFSPYDTFTTPSNCFKMKFSTYSNYGTTYHNDICINISNASRNGEYQPYQHTSLSIPSTRLDGVGTAQDYIEVVEDGENDYSLHLHKVMGEVDLGTLEWSDNGTFWGTADLASVIKKPASSANTILAIAAKYSKASIDVFNNAPSGLFAVTTGGGLRIGDTASPTGYLVYELANPTETTIAEHLTLAEVSAIAQNGGIISIVNENGHIVQPDMVCDVVISRSAS